MRRGGRWNGKGLGMPVRILIAERQAVYRAGLRALLEEEPQFCIVGEAENGTSVIQSKRLWETDVLLLDLALPGPPSAKTIVRTLTESSRLHILTLATDEDRWCVPDFLGLGALGCILEKSSRGELIRAVGRVAAGEYYVDPELVTHGIVTLGIKKQTPHKEYEQNVYLTTFEQEMCRLIMCGFTTGEIAKRLDISESAVETHQHNIMSTLGLNNRADLIRLVVTHKFLQTP